MPNLREFEAMVHSLSPGEKAQALSWIIRDLEGVTPGIDVRPEVCGGEACIVRTRIPVWVLERARRLGASEQELLAAYPALRAEDLVNAWTYVRTHIGEIDTQIASEEAA